MKSGLFELGDRVTLSASTAGESLRERGIQQGPHTVVWVDYDHPQMIKIAGVDEQFFAFRFRPAMAAAPSAPPPDSPATGPAPRVSFDPEIQQILEDYAVEVVPRVDPFEPDRYYVLTNLSDELSAVVLDRILLELSEYHE